MPSNVPCTLAVSPLSTLGPNAPTYPSRASIPAASWNLALATARASSSLPTLPAAASLKTPTTALAPSLSAAPSLPTNTTPMSVASEYGSSTLRALIPAGIADATGAELPAHLRAGEGFRCAASACNAGTEADVELPKPMKTTCGPCADATRVALPWYAVADAGAAEGVGVAVDALCAETAVSKSLASDSVEMPVPRTATLLGLLTARACKSRTSSAVMLPVAWLSA